MATVAEQKIESGNRLRRARLNMGWTQADLARNSGFHPDSIAKWERGKREIHPHCLQVLSALLNIEIRWLRADDVEEHSDGRNHRHDQ